MHPGAVLRGAHIHVVFSLRTLGMSGASTILGRHRIYEQDYLSPAGAWFYIGAEGHGGGVGWQGEGGVEGPGAAEIGIAPIARGEKDFPIDDAAGLIQEIQIDIHRIALEVEAADPPLDMDLAILFRQALIGVGYHQLSGIGFALVRTGGLNGNVSLGGNRPAETSWADALAGAQNNRQHGKGYPKGGSINNGRV